jgi:HK97 gp10 family phage protein
MPTFAENMGAFNAQASVHLDTTELDRIAAGLNTNTEVVLINFALEIEGLAKDIVAIDTGALKSSIHTRGKDGTNTNENKDYGEGHEQNEIPAAGGDVMAVVGTGMNYAAYVELGTSKMAAQPYLGPAVEVKSNKLNDGSMWRRLFE